ncbi:hypothetical protein EHS13_02975 [Paenibacillus psychroresistens]|uniref:CBM6 domain-containing protein n=1 Tax=Paenibacillus psychroresistens TaxID=1778678 RepID=A0A6B8RC97_9BACL|nr:LamG-like jellyroll fold domain-containing protein [Paenibacillus psychroresistens]QGQ93939.1 hypothetical protein EHS13_02975 [Paenibacillus psychroresistens]
MKRLKKLIVIAMLSLLVSSYSQVKTTEAAESGGVDITAVALGDIFDYDDIIGPSEGDTYSSTWANNDEVYTLHDDGNGFEGGSFVNHGINKLDGNPGVSTKDFIGRDLNPGSLGSSMPQAYSSSILDIGGTLYSVQRGQGSDYTQSIFYYPSILKSTDGGVNWVNHLGQSNQNPPFNIGNSMFPSTDNKWGWPSFIQYGKGGSVPTADNANNYVYLISYDTSATGDMNPWRGVDGDKVYLARIARSAIANLNKNDIEYYKGGDGMVGTNWTTVIDQSVPILTDLSNSHNNNIVYNYGLKRYVMTAYSDYFPDTTIETGKARFQFYTSQYPWGPWTKNLNYGLWGMTAANFLLPNKYTSSDGKKMWMAFSGGFNGNIWSYGYLYTPVYLSTGTVDAYQAESATLSGVNTATTHRGYEGTGFVQGFDTVGDKITFTVNNVNGTGYHIVRLRYANTNNGQMLSVKVNGKKVKQIYKLSQAKDNYKTSQDWADFSEIYYLNNGSNTFEIFQDTGDDGAGVKIDSINVSREQTYNEGANLAWNAAASSSTTYTGYTAAAVVDGSAVGYPSNSANEWASNGQGAGAWSQLTWGSAQTVNKIVLYDRPNTKDQVLSGTLTFSDGTSVNVGKLQNDGRAGTILTFPNKSVTWVKFTVNSVKSGVENIGLSEFEVYNFPFPPTAPPIGYWAFNESSGTSASDSSGFTKTGTVSGAAWLAGHNANALNFDGTNDYVSIPDAFDPTETTISAWIKPDDVSNRSVLTRTSSAGPTQEWSHQIRINSSGKLEGFVAEQAGGTKLITGTTTLSVGTWYHVALTIKNGGQMKLYVNGLSEGTPQSVTTMWTGGDRYYIGSNAAGSFGYTSINWFDGLIDEVKLFNSELSQSDIQGLMN